MNRNAPHGSVGPKRSPLGLAADPGGLPLYRAERVVGGIGSRGRRAIRHRSRHHRHGHRTSRSWSRSPARRGYAAPADIRGDRITADGRTFRYVDSESIVSDPAKAPAFDAHCRGTSSPSTATRTPARDPGRHGRSEAPASGVRADTGDLRARRADGSSSTRQRATLSQPRATRPRRTAARETRSRRIVLNERLAIANRARGQIRRPLGIQRGGDRHRGGPQRRHPRASSRTPDAPGVRHRRRGAEGAHRHVLLERPDAAGAARLGRRPRSTSRRSAEAHRSRSMSIACAALPRRSRGAHRQHRVERARDRQHAPARSFPTASTARRRDHSRRPSRVEPLQRGLPARPRLQPDREGRSAAIPRRDARGASRRAPGPVPPIRASRSCATACRSFPAASRSIAATSWSARSACPATAWTRTTWSRSSASPTPRTDLGTGLAQRAGGDARRHARAHGHAASLRAVPAVPVQRLDGRECLRGPLACVMLCADVCRPCRAGLADNGRILRVPNRDERDRPAPRRSERARAATSLRRSIRGRCLRPWRRCRRARRCPCPIAGASCRHSASSIRWFDPYDQNVLKGDLPLGDDPWVREHFPGARRAHGRRLVREPRRRLRHARGVRAGCPTPVGAQTYAAARRATTCSGRASNRRSPRR